MCVLVEAKLKLRASASAKRNKLPTNLAWWYPAIIHCGSSVLLILEPPARCCGTPSSVQ